VCPVACLLISDPTKKKRAPRLYLATVSVSLYRTPLHAVVNQLNHYKVEANVEGLAGELNSIHPSYPGANEFGRDSV
jgi:hypothetical protein